MKKNWKFSSQTQTSDVVKVKCGSEEQPGRKADNVKAKP